MASAMTYWPRSRFGGLGPRTPRARCSISWSGTAGASHDLRLGVPRRHTRHAALNNTAGWAALAPRFTSAVTICRHVPGTVRPENETKRSGDGRVAEDLRVVDRVNAIQAARDHRAALVRAVPQILRGHYRSNAQNTESSEN